jgi:hypothetical protein
VSRNALAPQEAVTENKRNTQIKSIKDSLRIRTEGGNLLYGISFLHSKFQKETLEGAD